MRACVHSDDLRVVAQGCTDRKDASVRPGAHGRGIRRVGGALGLDGGIWLLTCTYRAQYVPQYDVHIIAHPTGCRSALVVTPRLSSRGGCYLNSRGHIVRAQAAVHNLNEIVNARVLDMHDAILREPLDDGGTST